MNYRNIFHDENKRIKKIFKCVDSMKVPLYSVQYSPLEVPVPKQTARKSLFCREVREQTGNDTVSQSGFCQSVIAKS